MALNLEACRTCLKTSKKNFNLYSDIGDDKLISEVLMEEIPIKLHKDDGLPVKICDTCLKKLKQIRDFKTMVIESDTKLHELNKNVEKETLEDNSATDIDSIKVEICEEEVDPLSHTNDTEMPTFVEVPVEKIIENSASVSGVKNCLPAKEKEEWSHVDEFEIKDEFMKEAEESGEVEKIEIISENVGNEELSNSEMEDNDLASLEDHVIDESSYTHDGELTEENNQNSIPEDSSSEQPVMKLSEVKQKKRMMCTICNRSFGYRYYFEFHLREHEGTKQFSCEVCGKKFAKLFVLNKHKRVHSDDRTFSCEICGKTFKHLSVLLTHRMVHAETKIHECDQCDKSFKTKNSLNQHLLVHDPKKVVCNLCGKVLAGKSQLSKHLQIHSENVLPCPTCGKAFKTKTNLNKHVSRVHLKVRNHACDYCGKCFNSSTERNIHKRLHSGEKPFTCKVCGNKFRQTSVLMRHMRVHTGETPYHCELCPEKFKYSHHLVKHMEKHKKKCAV